MQMLQVSSYKITVLGNSEILHYLQIDVTFLNLSCESIGRFVRKK